MATNRAAWLRSKGTNFHVADAPYPTLDPNYVIIKNTACSINPIDYKAQQAGFYIQNWPTVQGNDAAGEVVEVGSEVSNIKKGDRVIANCLPLASGRPQEGSFQTFTTAPAVLCCPIPDLMTFEEDCVLPLSISTAAAGLYGETGLGLPLPTTNTDVTATSTGNAILVWGGSSSVGSSAIQLAVVSGLHVVATASSSNFDVVKAIGAEAVFDRTSATVVADIVTYLEQKQLKLVGAYDCIGLSDTRLSCAKILSASEGGKIAIVNVPPAGLPDGVIATKVFTPSINDNGIGQAIWITYLPRALQRGDIKPFPRPFVFGKGLESLQGAANRLREGLSASKIVVVL